jgi:drug/metabolite transporter (DMT)-like permease
MTVLAEQRTKRVFESIPFLTNEVLAELATLVIFMLWGVNFSATKKCLEYTSPLVLNALCFGSGGLVVLVFQYKKLRMVDMKGALIVGFFMCISSVLQTVALNYTLVAKTSFYSCLDIPITAAFEMLTRRLSWGEIVGVISTLGGAFLLSWDGIAINPNYGDWVAIIATVPSAAYYVASAHFCTEEAKVSICVGQLLIASVLCFLAAPFFEVPVLQPTWELGYGLLFTGCLSCGLALYVLTWAQM